MLRGTIAPIEQRLEWLIQSVRIEQCVLRAKALARGADRVMLDMAHETIRKSMRRLERSIAHSVKKAESCRGALSSDVAELTRIWQLKS